MWQFTQVSGLSERYDEAFDMCMIYINNPTIIPSVVITKNRQFAGGLKYVKRFNMY
jgi:hypothetical protein